MALFRRKKTDSVLPEVDKYYEGERRDRAGLAWLLALVSVAIVALILVGVFWAGRWTYRQLTKDDNKVATSNNGDNVPSFDGSSNTDDTKTDEEKAAEQKRTEEEAARKQAEEEAAKKKAAEEEAARNTAQTTPKTGDDATDLPSTGPADTFAIFTIASAGAGAIHYAVSRRKLQRN